MNRLCLGTVQFGMPYGINNTLGQPSMESCFRMLDSAIGEGITVLDTARAYGTAELVLGEYFAKRKNQNKVNVISKLRPNIIEAGEHNVYSIVKTECEESLKRLHVDHLDGYLLHTPQYVRNTEIVRGLERLKKDGLVSHIGVSIYEISDGEAAIDTGVVDYIQLPYSVLDQRGKREGFLLKAKEVGVTIFARSAFLQGLFFMEKERIPSYLADAKPYLDLFEKTARKYNVDKVSALMHFVTQEQNIDYLVFGVDTEQQLLEDLECYRKNNVPEEFKKEMEKIFQKIEKSIIFPSLWSNGRKAE